MNGAPHLESTYATRDTADEALAKMTGMSEPWFLWVAFNAAHTPFHVPPSNLSVPPGSEYALTTPFSNPSNPSIPEMHRAMLEAMDIEIGRIPSLVDFSTTTVIFLGDNGTDKAATEAPWKKDHAKLTVYEGGIHVPLIIRSPVIAPEFQGSESAALVNLSDIYATVAELAGRLSTAEDSISLIPYLLDPSTPGFRTTVYAESFKPNGFLEQYETREQAIRGERYKLIRRSCFFREFFDLQADPFEQANRLPVENLTAEERAAYDFLDAELAGLYGTDCDRDGVADAQDNCVFHFNPLQVDSNLDGIGNRCDADYDDDGVVGAPDFNVLRASFGSHAGDPNYNPAVDFDASGAIGGEEFNFFRSQFAQNPGPSGLPCAYPFHDGSPPCTANSR